MSFYKSLDAFSDYSSQFLYFLAETLSVLLPSCRILLLENHLYHFKTEGRGCDFVKDFSPLWDITSQASFGTAVMCRFVLQTSVKTLLELFGRRVERSANLKFSDSLLPSLESSPRQHFRSLHSASSLYSIYDCQLLQQRGSHSNIYAQPATQVVEVSSSKTGKHGHEICHFFAIDIFTSNKLVDIVPSSYNYDVKEIFLKFLTYIRSPL